MFTSWITSSTIFTIIFKKTILSEKFDGLITKLDEPTIRKFQRFLDQKDEDEDIFSNIKNDLKLLL